jgi:hypothetical protein
MLNERLLFGILGAGARSGLHGMKSDCCDEEQIDGLLCSCYVLFDLTWIPFMVAYSNKFISEVTTVRNRMISASGLDGGLLGKLALPEPPVFCEKLTLC